jgi:hypothetical protein
MIFKCKAFASKEVEKDDLFFQRSILPVFVHRKKNNEKMEMEIGNVKG